MKLHWLEFAAADVPADNDWLCAGEQARLNAMRVPKRRSDWRLGRWTAKHAVAACLNLPGDTSALANIEIRPAASGAPEVFLVNQPATVSISLTHRAGVAACAVGPLGTVLGCDLELIEPRSNAFLADYFTLGERQLIARTSPAGRDRVANLLWSAKESTLKALSVGLRLDSRCVIVRYVDGLLSQDSDELTYARSPALALQSPPNVWHPLQVASLGDRRIPRLVAADRSAAANHGRLPSVQAASHAYRSPGDVSWRHSRGLRVAEGIAPAC